MYRNTYVEVDLNNIASNVKNIIKRYNYKYYIGVVKGNAYGHGYGIVDTLIQNGINFLAVASLEEAINVRKCNEKIGILCLEPIDSKYIEIASKKDISIMIDDYDYYNEIKDSKYKLKLHLKIDSGMNRLGFNDQIIIDKVYKDIIKNDNFHLEGIFTHFSTSGLYDKNYDNQVEKFKYLTKTIDLSKINIVHLDRSSTMCSHEKLDFVNGVRLGIIMYGFDVVPKEKTSFKDKLKKIKWNYIRKRDNISLTKPYEDLNLKQAFCLISEVFEVKEVKKDNYIGYGTMCKAESDMKIAIIDIGYSDGISKRRYGSNVSINAKLFPIIADVCMGMIIVKVDESVRKHDKVTVIGNEIPIKYVSNYIHTSVYEVMTMIDSSIERRYK